MHGSQSIFPGGSSSRPFLNMLNPMGRTYQGYMQANQSVVEEEDEEGASNDLESGQPQRSSIFTTKAHGKRRVSWGGDASEMNVLRPNIRQADPKEGDESSDDEVPQDVMIEAARRPPSPQRSAKGKERETRKRPLVSARKSSKPILPTNTSDTPVSIPPRPSEINTDPMPQQQSEPLHEPQSKHMHGLDDHERALWNWVNVYNLDAFLQEAYYYYEGKGLYSIALSRGLNLLSVPLVLPLASNILIYVCSTVGFVIGFSTFLLGCVDYSRIRHDKVTRLSEVVVKRCVSRFSGFTLLFFVLFTAFFVWQLVSYVLNMLRLVDMYRFYTHLLHIPDVRPDFIIL